METIQVGKWLVQREGIRIFVQPTYGSRTGTWAIRYGEGDYGWDNPFIVPKYVLHFVHSEKAWGTVTHPSGRIEA